VVHGSALAGQGQSQALVTATIGEADDQAKSEGITGQTSKQLMVQFGDRMAAAAEVSPLIAHDNNNIQAFQLIVSARYLLGVPKP